MNGDRNYWKRRMQEAGVVEIEIGSILARAAKAITEDADRRSAGVTYVPAMTFKDIGKELGVSHEAIRKTYQMALRKLRRQPQMQAIAGLLAGQERLCRDSQRW